MAKDDPADKAREALRARIREMLARSGLNSLSALAEKAGLSDTTVTQFMNGRRRSLPGSRTLSKLEAAAEALGGPRPASAVPSTPENTESPPVRFAVTPGIGARIQAVRMARYVSVAELARQTGMTAAQISAIEAGTLPVDVDTLARLRWGAEMPADWVLFGDAASLPPRLLQLMVTAGGAPGAPEPARELRAAIGDLPDAHDPRTLHEDQAGLHRTIQPLRS